MLRWRLCWTAWRAEARCWPGFCWGGRPGRVLKLAGGLPVGRLGTGRLPPGRGGMFPDPLPGPFGVPAMILFTSQPSEYPYGPPQSQAVAYRARVGGKWAGRPARRLLGRSFQPTLRAGSGHPARCASSSSSSGAPSNKACRCRWHRPSGSSAGTSAPQWADQVGPLWAQQRHSRGRVGSQWAWLAKPPDQPPGPGSSPGPASIWSTRLCRYPQVTSAYFIPAEDRQGNPRVEPSTGNEGSWTERSWPT